MSLLTRVFFLLLIAFPLLVYSQQYVEVSGQTETFDLTAGATAGWDNSASGIRPVPGTAGFRPFAGIVRQFQQTLVIEGTVPPGARCMLYSLNGHLCARLVPGQDNTIVLPRNLGAGYYLARIETPSSVLSTFAFLATRQP
jgi:hypothetical protein